MEAIERITTICILFKLRLNFKPYNAINITWNLHKNENKWYIIYSIQHLIHGIPKNDIKLWHSPSVMLEVSDSRQTYTCPISPVHLKKEKGKGTSTSTLLVLSLYFIQKLNNLLPTRWEQSLPPHTKAKMTKTSQISDSLRKHSLLHQLSSAIYREPIFLGSSLKEFLRHLIKLL